MKTAMQYEQAQKNLKWVQNNSRLYTDLKILVTRLRPQAMLIEAESGDFSCSFIRSRSAVAAAKQSIYVRNLTISRSR